jgi:hypothetical protein
MMLRKIIARFVDFTLLRLSKSSTVDGIWIGVFSDEDQQEILLQVRNALMLVREHDAKRYKLVIASFDRIWVTYMFGAVGHYLPEQRRCQLDAQFVISVPAEFIASTIVHEATHARLLKVGIPYTYENRHRVEKVCIRQELSFARRVPSSGNLQAHIRQKLLLTPEFWSQKASANRLREALTNSEGGLPKWLLRRLFKSA